MELQDKIDNLKDARDKVASVFEREATDESPDNGNLTILNEAILNLNKAIKSLEDRE